MWKQIRKFDINKMGNKKGYCLQNVRMGFDIPAKNESAKADMLENEKNGTLHDMSTLPINVSVPVYVDSSSVYEHIIVCDKGTFYSDGQKLTSINGLKFFGWGETCNGVRIVENVSQLRCKAHIQDIGWTDWINENELVGTENIGKRLEALIFDSKDEIEVQAHIQDIGWQEWKKNGEIIGTVGESKRIEALRIKTNRIIEISEHIENIGWLPVSIGNDVIIGTVGKSLRLEGFKIKFK